jgi:uncharacterized iron-regulated protein
MLRRKSRLRQRLAAAGGARPWRRRMQRMPLHFRLALRHVAALALLVLAGCGSPPPTLSLPATPLRAGPGQALLLGEVHDNAAQHALRRDLLAALLARGDRPALLLEQFDRERQAALDAASQPLPAPSPAALDAQVDAVVQAGGAAPGWHWPFYRPYIRLALAHGLPIVAANVSRADARLVMQQGLAATGWRADVPDDIRQAQADSIEASHCGQLDAAAAARLSQAQVARDQFMATLVALHAGRGVVLLAGNGHVRADIGVPRWLAPGLRARTQVVGALESTGPGDHQAYDTVLRTAAQPRPDPCAGLRMQAPAASAPR